MALQICHTLPYASGLGCCICSFSSSVCGYHCCLKGTVQKEQSGALLLKYNCHEVQEKGLFEALWTRLPKFCFPRTSSVTLGWLQAHSSACPPPNGSCQQPPVSLLLLRRKRHWCGFYDSHAPNHKQERSVFVWLLRSVITKWAQGSETSEQGHALSAVTEQQCLKTGLAKK